MAYYCRKIKRSKWDSSKVAEDEVCADVISSCLRTHDGALSLWRSADLKGLELIKLALASTMDHAETFDLIFFEDTLLDPEIFPREEEPGDTPIEKLRSLHINVCRLDVHRIGDLATIIGRLIKKDGNFCIRVTKAEMIRLLRQAVADGLVELDRLRKDVAKTIT